MKSLVFSITLLFGIITSSGVFATDNKQNSQESNQSPITCGERQLIVDGLYQSYNETQMGAGIVNEDSIVEIFVNDTTKTWTLLTTSIVERHKISCIIATGIGWYH